MPTVSIARDDLFGALGKAFTDEEFDHLCFEFGIELDEVTTEREMARKQDGSAEEGGEDRVIYKIEVPANRYDLLCLEGLTIALRVFLGAQATPSYRVVAPPAGEPHRIVVKPATKQIRPYVVGAVLRNLKLDHTKYNSFLDLQDKLHFNICRRRTLVAIGTHDLDTLQGPFTYDARAPDDISFVPLMQDREFTARELLDYYRDPQNADGKHLRPYTDIIYDSPVYPVITDSNGTVLSLPPIINGTHSKISKDTRNCFIECTAVDIAKAQTVLNVIVSLFSLHCEEPFTVESVQVVYEEQPGRIDAGTHTYPTLEPRIAHANLSTINRVAGIELGQSRICELLTRMELAAAPLGDDKIEVTVPALRSDILHECDIVGACRESAAFDWLAANDTDLWRRRAEDVAIAFGYNNIQTRLPGAATEGKQQPINKLSDLLRHEIAQAGYTEVLTLGLCSREENYAFLNHAEDGLAVTLANPKTVEYQVARTRLLPGMLKTVRENRQRSVGEGMKLFEISDVVLRDVANDVGARNERRLCALYMGPTAGFEVVHGLVDRVMQLVEVKPRLLVGDAVRHYFIEPAEDPTYFKGRCARLVVVDPVAGHRVQVGTFGILHPSVLANFSIKSPCSAVELNLEHFL